MSRFIVIILLIAIFFFSGMMYGGIKSAESVDIKDEMTEEIEDETTQLTDRTDITEELTLEERPAFIQKIANTFERMTSYTFELIISFLYTIANYFFR